MIEGASYETELPPEAARARRAYYGEGGIASCIRTVRGATPENKLRVLENVGREYIKLARNALLDDTEVFDVLQNLAVSDGLIETHGQDEVQAVLARAATVPDDLYETKRHNEHAGIQKRRFILFRDLALTSSKTWLVRNLLGRGEGSAWYGKPGSGKSVAVQDLSMHIAWGRSWNGRKVQQGAVLYVALERQKLVERRAIAFRNKHGCKDLPFAIVGGVYDFRDPQTAVQIAEIVAEVEKVTSQEVVLIVIDTLSRALCGGDENSPKDMGAIVNATSVLQAHTKAHVLWVHHMPLDGGDRMRGHGALLGAMDTTIHVVKSDTIRSATVVKANDSDEGEQIVFSLKSEVIGKDEDGVETTAPIVVPVEGRGPVDQSARSAKLPKAAQTALRALENAISECGTVPPPSSHIPPNLCVVTVEQWRQYAYRMGISAADATPRAQQVSFKRQLDYLIGSSRVGIWDELVWTP